MTAAANKPVFRPMLTEAQRILRLIESVGADTPDRMLDEIDARVYCLRNGLEFASMRKSRNGVSPHGPFVRFTFRHNGVRQVTYLKRCEQGTRSRDALKALRPTGWRLAVSNYKPHHWTGILILDDKVSLYAPSWLHTEYLAELHAIVQAIDFEQTHKSRAP